MKTIEINDIKLGVRASTHALRYYDEEFGGNLLGDVAKFQKEVLPELVESNFINYDALFILHVVWAMNKAANYDEEDKFPDFKKWCEKYEDIPVADPRLIGGVIQEANAGWFPREKRSSKKEAKKE